MTETAGTLRIEIIDPAREPLLHDPTAAARVSAPPDDTDELFASLRDAWHAAAERLDPLRRRSAVLTARGRRMSRAIHERSLQRRHDGNPRRGSAVRQHVFASFATIERELGAMEKTFVVGGGLRLDLTSDFRPMPGGGHQADARLALRGSWPRLPLVVRVEPWWRGQSVVTAELRTRRRLRYPRRYFAGAHAAARSVGAALAPSP
ncbi:MAG: hypothetical protein RIB98_01685 [Acidimicrobiales bacterium]